MKCPKCGMEIFDQELSRGLIHNRIILATASIAIIAVLVTSTVLLLAASSPKPQLAGDLTSNYTYDGEGPDYIIQVHGYIYNTGSVGCFAVATIKLSDDRGWSSETPVNLSWMPVSGRSAVS